MPAYLEVNSKILVFGVPWTTVEHSKKEEGAITKFCRAHEATHSVRVVTETYVAAGVISRDSFKKDQTILSAAALFASVAPTDTNTILVFPISGTQTALIAIVNGLPYLDVVVPPEKVIQRIETLNKEGVGGFKFYGILPEYDEVGVCSSQELLGGVIKQSEFVKFKDKRNLWIFALGFLAVCVMASGVVVWKKEQRRQQAEELKKKQIDHVAVYRNNISVLLASAKFTGADAYASIWNVIKSRQADIGGWTLTSVACTKTGCDESWTANGGNIRSFMGTSRLGVVKPELNVKSLVNSIPITTKVDAISIESIPRKDEFLLNVGALEQSLSVLNIIYKFEKSKVVGISNGVEIGKVPVEMQIFQGTFKASAPLGLAPELLNKYFPDNATLNSVKVTIGKTSQELKMDVTGVYYVRN